MSETYKGETEILNLVEKFNLKTLKKSEWTHAAHLTVGIWYVKNYEKYEALCRLKSGIISFNLTTDTPNTGSRGYHETLTVFWAEVLHFFVEEFPQDSLLESCNRFLSSRLSDRKFPFFFYNETALMSTLYRSRFVAPEKQPLTAEVLKGFVE